MKDFADIPRTNGSFPSTSSVADASPGDKTGTPLHKTWVDHSLAFPQAALQGAHLTPNDSSDVAGASQGDIESSQVLQAIQQMFCPPGSIMAWPGDTLPDGARYLPLDGRVVLRATYPRLVANVERAYVSGGSYYRANAGGGTDPAGDYLKLPDYDGVALRGRDVAAVRDPDGASRNFGDLQGDALERHNHIIDDLDAPAQYPYMAGILRSAGSSNMPRGGGVAGDVNIEASATHIGEDISSSFTNITGVGTVAEETRMKNSVVQWVIAY